MQETQVQPLGREDPLGKEMANHSSILVWENPWKRSLAGYSLWSCIVVGHDLVTKQQQYYSNKCSLGGTVVSIVGFLILQ